MRPAAAAPEAEGGVPGLAGSSRDEEKYRFYSKFLLKSNDFDCPGWPGAAGMDKSIDFY